jgi:ferrous iron transport protein B
MPNNTTTIALVGNPNSGKTTLFNALTGMSQKVGNWAGVTVEYKTGEYSAGSNIHIVDTPGVYSLTPFSIDEEITANFLLHSHPDVVVNIVDSTNLERNLYLTTQLLELNTPLVVALNMTDELEKAGMTVDAGKLSRLLGCACVSISAATGEGVGQLMQVALGARKGNRLFAVKSPTAKPEDAVSERYIWIEGVVRDVVSRNKVEIADQARNDEYKKGNESAMRQNSPPEEGWRTKSDGVVVSSPLGRGGAKRRGGRLNNQPPQYSTNPPTTVGRDDPSAPKKQQLSISDLKATTPSGTRRLPPLHSRGIKQPQRITVATINSREPQRHTTFSLDNIVLNKWLAFPILALVMTAVFFVAMGGIGRVLSDFLTGNVTTFLKGAFAAMLSSAGKPWLTSLVVDGIIGGVMGVVGFLPQILLLFMSISLLEASGYMARIAFIMDRLLSRLGLSGKSFVSMILGCGCSVPAVLATRTIKNIKERNATIILTPFVPCSAKLAVISFFTAEISGGSALLAVSFYFLSILTVIVVGVVMKFFSKNDEGDTFIMELPNYRTPSAKNVLLEMWQRGKAFLVRAGTVIFLMSVVLWLLQSFDWRFRYVTAENSMLAGVGRIIAPLFSPLGFGNWQCVVATLSGLIAKETVVTTLNILLPAGVGALLSPAAAYSFVMYNLLTIPCMATVSAMFSELGSKKEGIKALVIQLVVSYVAALFVYGVAKVLGG